MQTPSMYHQAQSHRRHACHTGNSQSAEDIGEEQVCIGLVDSSVGLRVDWQASVDLHILWQGELSGYEYGQSFRTSKDRERLKDKTR